VGAAGLDLMRHLISSTPSAFATVFAVEAIVFVCAALFATRLGRVDSDATAIPSALPVGSMR
jgi:hypothetical protein